MHTWMMALLAAFWLTPAQAQLPDRYYQPVKEVAPQQLSFSSAGVAASIPVFTSTDWMQPHPELSRAVLIFHGLLRNGDVYFADGLKAQAAAGDAGAKVLVIAPQFITDFDARAHHLPATTLGFGPDNWAGGEPALTPAPISGFDAIDAILAHLTDRALFPNLKTVVIAGFSAGGQVVQRYAVVGNGEAALTKAGIATKYVVSDPSSYLYFDAARPMPMAVCAKENGWKYGFAADVPPYVTATPAALEARYAQRDVLYLVGGDDIDPNHPVLDKSCGGEAQGPHRFARAHAYFSMMQARHPSDLKQQLIDVPGIAHEGGKMFNTVCGLDALFGVPGCAALDGKP